MKSITISAQAVERLNRDVPDELTAVVYSAVSSARVADVLTLTFDSEKHAVSACLALRCFLPASLAHHVAVTSNNLTPLTAPNVITMQAFFALPEIVALQEIQKRHHYRTAEHRKAFDDMRALASRYVTAEGVSCDIFFGDY